LSYSVNVLGYGYSRELQAEGPLGDVLAELDARFSSFDLGSFLHGIGGMQYREVEGGFYSWMLYRETTGGGMMPVNEGVNMLHPRPGERIYVMYKFFPSGSYEPRRAYALPAEPAPPDEEPIIEYHFTPMEEYTLPELIEYTESTGSPEEQSLLAFLDEEEREQPLPVFSKPKFTKLATTTETYQIIRPRPTPLRVAIPRFEDNRELERFLMDVLAKARLDFVLAARLKEEEPATPLLRV
jgi:hypothetical protein